MPRSDVPALRLHRMESIVRKPEQFASHTAAGVVAVERHWRSHHGRVQHCLVPEFRSFSMSLSFFDISGFMRLVIPLIIVLSILHDRSHSTYTH